MQLLRILTVLALGSSVVAQAGVRLPKFFSDHMVVQRDQPIPVWGWAQPGAKVSVRFGGQAREVTTDASGAWRVDLTARAASSEGQALRVACGDDVVTLQDVLVGEVWLCSGQSNMAWTVNGADGAAAAKAAATDSRVRMFTGGRVSRPEPQDDVPGSWVPAAPETVGDFSATAYYFGRDLVERLDVPIGLVNVSWGGSSVQAWTTMETLRGLDSAKSTLDAWTAAAEEIRVKPELRAGADVDDASWERATLPAMFKDLGHDIDGVIWFRRSIDIPKDWSGKDLTVELGGVDDEDHTYFQGVQIGHTNNWQALRRYRIAKDKVRAGKAVLAVRVRDGSGPGGFHSEAATMRIYPEGRSDDSRSLAGDWRMKVTSTVSPMPSQHRPAHLCNGMIHPLRHIGMRGVIWYQGENNAIREEAVDYYELFPAFIHDLRRQLARPKLPFVFVQLPDFGENDSTFWNYPITRDAQLRAFRDVAHVGMAVTIDIGDPKDIHPRNKVDVGKRLARWARARVYGEDGLAPTGPIYQKAAFARDGSAVVSFETFGGRLATRGGSAVGGFEVAGSDKVFHAATGTIAGDTVVLRSDAVETIAAVRYAWQNTPASANLVGADGLPASPFRSDDWKLFD